MRMRLWPALLLVFVSVFSTSSASAQAKDPFGGGSEIGFWAGFSPQSGSTVGGSPDRKFFLTAIRYSRALKNWRDIGFRYTIDLVPAAVVFQPKNGFQVLSGGQREAIYGTGISPVGLQLNFRRQKALQPFGEINGGLLYFAQNVPVPGSSNFNFTFDFGAGAQYFFRRNRAFSAGYMFHHISNAETAPHNPGIDNNIIFGGLSWYW
jgi:Lipid A 3-O-deacylase (PagL)